MLAIFSHMPEYFAQSEPEDYKKRSHNWKTAIGLQAVDGLVPSQYLLDIANLNIKGELPLNEVQQKLQSYYENKPAKTTDEERQKEADLVSLKITNEPFESHSWYFRNALVRANYRDLSKKIYATTKYLEMFFENALLGAKNELKNRELNIMASLD